MQSAAESCGKVLWVRSGSWISGITVWEAPTGEKLLDLTPGTEIPCPFLLVKILPISMDRAPGILRSTT